MKIKNVHGRHILDSRGFPTLECSITLDNDATVVASVPSGASVGYYEAVALYDHDNTHFGGKGVLKALEYLERDIAPCLMGKTPDIVAMDSALIALDGTSNKAHLGANTILAASIAVIRAQALVEGIELFTLINQLWGFERPTLPLCMFNIINGGMHAQSGLSVQEFMIMPHAQTFAERLEIADTVYAHLKQVLQIQHYSTALGDEGGFAPLFAQSGRARERAALDFLQEAVGSVDAQRIDFCIDAAASHFYGEDRRKYQLHGELLDASGMIDWYQQLCEQYPIVSLEDGLEQDDWDGWKLMTQRMGNIQIVGDDLFVTNPERIRRGIERGVANAVLIKPNQIGTVSETIDAIKLCKQAGYKTIISHRSGETNDAFIADLVVGTAAGQFKAGAPARGERVAKYNRLLAIEALLG